MKDKFIITAKNLAIQISKISEDPYAKVGAVILNNEGRILSMGYNGLAPKKKAPKSFWEDRDKRRNYMIHAEMNALSCISRYDNPHAIYVTLSPCTYCANLIASYGIKEVYFSNQYPLDEKAKDIFNFYKISYRKV